jgi:hypothetical protein
LDRKLIVEDEKITEVHFSNRTDNSSLVCETWIEDGITVVNVPNILLQSDWRLYVYAYDSSYTKHSECFEVVGRTKPADYIYTEVEIISWENFKQEVEAELEGMASKEYVDNEIATFDFIKVVDALPEEGLPNRIYLVPKTEALSQDLFDEFIWINGKWEWLTTKQMEVELTNYVPKTAFTYDEATETLTIEI